MHSSLKSATDINEAPRPATWSWLSKAIGVALWTSFIAACLETAAVFACFDPLTLGFDDIAPSLAALRPIIYGLGFFVFWLFTFIGTAMTAFVLVSGSRAASPSPERPTRS